MLSISVFLLLAGWKGVRGGLSQLIYHIKYQPSSTFSLPLFLVPPCTFSLFSHSFPLTPFSSPPTIYISSSHLSSPLFYHLFARPTHPHLLTVPLSFPHTSPSAPSSSFLKVSISLTLFFFFNNCHMPPRLTSRLPRHDPRSLTFPLPFKYTDTHSPPSCQICRGTICLIIQKNAVMQEDFFNQS